MAQSNPSQPKDMLFFALTTLKQCKDGLVRQLRYRFPRPSSSISAKELANCPGCTYTLIASKEEHVLSMPRGIDAAICYRIEQIHKGVIPERFMLELENGRVFGEGHVITVGNQLVSDVSVYFSQHEDHWLLGIGKLPEPVKVAGTVAVLNSTGSSNYFHWTLDTLPRFALLKGHEGIDWFYVGSTVPFQQAWLAKLGIPKKKILPVSPGAHIQADRLLVPSFSHHTGLYTDAAFRFIRSFIPPLPAARRKIYISRSNARRRRIVNEDAILPLLQEHGYEIHRLAGLTIDAQMELFGSASHVVAAHGAELTNLVYCPPGTKVLEIFSPYYINLCFWSMATQLGLDYSCMLGTGGEKLVQQGKTSLQVWRNIRISPEQFQRRLEKLAAHE